MTFRLEEFKDAWANMTGDERVEAMMWLQTGWSEKNPAMVDFCEGFALINQPEDGGVDEVEYI